MAVISTPTKARLGARAARSAVKHPRILKLGVKSAKPAIKIKLGTKAAKGVAKNPALVKLGARGAKTSWTIAGPLARFRAHRRYERALDTARELGESLLTYGGEAAIALGLVEPPAPKPSRTVPRVIAGAVLGAATVYFLEPGSGAEHRRQLTRLVS